MIQPQDLNTIKALLQINQSDTSKDQIFSILYDFTTQKVLNYCNRTDVPAGLKCVVIEIVIQYFKKQYQFQSSISNQNTSPQKIIKSETIGDYSITYDTSSQVSTQKSTLDSVLNDYTSQLNQFRKLKFI